MASFFGEMATSVGGAFTEHSENVREERLVGEDAQRDMQLTKMRMAHDTKRTQMSIDADDLRAKRQNEYDTMTQEQQNTFTSEESELGREADIDKYEYQGEVDMVTAALRTFASGQKDGTVKGNGWTTFQQQSYDDYGQPVTAHFASREGITWRQIGDKYVQAGDPNKIPYDFGGDIAKQRAAEAALWAGELTAQEFDDSFDYVPSTYITGRIATGNNQARSYLKELGIDIPRGAPGRDFKLPEVVPLSGEIQSILDRSAEQFNVPSALLLSVMDVESLGVEDRANATSTAGARGHMQIMPPTFMEVGKKIFGDDVKLDITKPEHNIPAGAAYLSEMMNKYEGNVAYALAAYNAGPGKVDKAIKSGGASWINDLPPETRSYLPKALGRYYSLTSGGDKGSTGALDEAETNIATDAASAAPTDAAPAAPAAVPGAEEVAPAAEMGPEALPVDEQIVDVEPVSEAAVEGLAKLPPRDEQTLRGTSVEARQARGQRRDLMKELSDEDVEELIANIVNAVGGQQGDLSMLKSERGRREREATILPHDLLFNTEKGQKFKEDNLARIRAEQAERETAKEPVAETP